MPSEVQPYLAGHLTTQSDSSWRCQSIGLQGENTLRLRFVSADGDKLRVSVVPRDTPGPVFRRLDRIAIRYDGVIRNPAPARKREVAEILGNVAQWAEALVDLQPGCSIAEALGRDTTPRTIVFGRDSLQDLLAPEIAKGRPIAGDWLLSDVYPTSHLQEASDGLLALVLDFRRQSDGQAMLIIVRKPDPTIQAFVQTHNFTLVQHAGGRDDAPGADVVRELVAFLLTLRDHEDLEVTYPSVEADLSTPLLTSGRRDADTEEMADEWLNLAIDADCGQACNFCSVKEITPPHDGDASTLMRLFADLDSNRERGVRRVRINGYDPLAYSRILDVLARIREVGYEEACLFSPCTRLADEEFCADVLATLPEVTTFTVPVYSVRAEVHDRVVGRPGAFDLVMQALERITAARGPEAVTILTAVTHPVVGELGELAAFARDKGYRFGAHLPYPTFEGRSDRYFSAAPRQTDVAEVIATNLASGSAINVSGVSPCVVFRVLTERGLSPKDWILRAERPIERHQLLPGTEYRDPKIRHRAQESQHDANSAASVPCPAESDCSLSTICAGAFLRAYVELYGDGEFSAVSLRDLLKSSP